MDAIRFAKDLRELAAFFESHPDITTPPDLLFSIHCGNKAGLVAVARSIGEFKKEYQDSFFSLRKEFGCIRVDWFVTRSEVCSSKIVGVKRVEEKVIPAHDEPIVEWECFPTPLLADKKTEQLPAAEPAVTEDEGIPF